MHYALKNESYPIETEEQLKIATDYFDKNITKFSPIDRVGISHNMEKRASELNVNLDLEFVPNYSRMMKKNAGYSPDFEYNMKLRKEACEVNKVEVKLGDQLVKAAELIGKLTDNKDNVTPLNMVSSISELDKLANLESHYDERVMDPVFTVFGSNANPNFDSIKLAEGVSDVELKKAANDKSFISKIAETFGANFADDFKSSPVDIFKSMPAPEKQLIVDKIGS